MAAEQAAPPPAAGALLHVAVVIDHYGDDESLPLHRCRICFEQDEDEALVDLSCLCKGELSKVHASCGNAWFKRRGSGVCELCNAPVFVLSAEALAEYKLEQQRAEARAAATRRRDRALQPRVRTKWDQIRMVIFLVLFMCVAGAIWSSAMGLFRHVKAH